MTKMQTTFRNTLMAAVAVIAFAPGVASAGGRDYDRGGNARADVYQQNRADVRSRSNRGNANAFVYQQNRANVRVRANRGDANANVYQSNNANVRVQSN